ncbi:biotin--[acetyl-CoA-carboxylase] ligase [Zhaonella formicivorans]|uniref:biotin--[acetyl-CoA-carboxylase] ligase n=1 Tax=Zhaonella formicivorans TaxID=2528593 RepID=UPI0010EBE8D4|nr:biotin--[acetyl-CoA-carboxylase] ligase [Zhaonella formicivorans]
MREDILNLLKRQQGQFVSGEELSRMLNVSRTAVWKHIQALREEGYRIESFSKLGYRLEGVPDKMLPQEIANGLNTKSLGKNIIFFEEIESTNIEAKKRADQHSPEGLMVIAESQTGGKGRLGRSWLSPAGKGLWFSLILRPPISPLEAGQITLVAAIAITQVLREQYFLPAGIKWPNDILLNSKKVCGILTEMKAEADAVNYLVLGIGINVNLQEADFPEDVRTTATSLAIEQGRQLNRVKLLQTILEALEKLYYSYLEDGFGPVLELWKSYNVTLGKEVKITTWQNTLSGKAVDVDAAGGLVVLLPDGSSQTFYSGDVTLKESRQSSVTSN